jgi:hypothetical protein
MRGHSRWLRLAHPPSGDFQEEEQRILPSGYLLFAEGCYRLIVVLVHPEYCV